jgi:hypothetical protein
MNSSGKSMRAQFGEIDYVAIFFRKWRNVILILFVAYMVLNTV